MTDQASTEQVSSGAPEAAPTQEYVPVELASDEDISDFLKKNPIRYDGDEDADGHVDEVVPEKADAEAEQEAPEGETKQAAPTPGDEKVTLTKAQLAELTKSAELATQREKQVEQSRAFINRRNQEIGDLRKKLREAKDRLGEDLDEVLQTQPRRGLETADKIKEIDSTIADLDQEEAFNQHVSKARELVEKNVDTSKFSAEDVADVLLSDGLDQDYVMKFLQFPEAHGDGLQLVQLYKRATERRVTKELAYFCKKLHEQNQKLIEESKRWQDKPNRVLNKVTRALNTPERLNGGSATVSASRRLSDQDLTKLSDAELDALVKEVG